MVFNNVILKVKDPQRIDEIAGLPVSRHHIISGAWL